MSLNDEEEEDYWEDILSDIQERRCTPIIGEAVSHPYIPPSREIASSWAKQWGYPLEDSYQLSRVAQFLAIEKADEVYPKRALRREVGGIRPPDFSTKEYENTAYSVLADLNLPIYITTNYDLFMEAALKQKGKSPVTEFCRWNKELVYQRKAGIPLVFEADEKYAPEPEKPLVYHVYGLYDLRDEYRPEGRNIDLPRSLVLTEKDYVDFTLTISKEEEENILPTCIRDALSLTSLLVIGYGLDDLSFRVFFQGVVKTQTKPSGTILSVQLRPTTNNPDQAIKYLRRYTQFMFGDVRVYWGDPSTFCEELRHRRDNFKKKQSSI